MWSAARPRLGPRLIVGAAMLAALAGGLGAAALGGHGAALLAGAVAAAVCTAGALGLARVLLDLRDQQRRIIAQLELQTQILHNAARLVHDLAEEETGPPVSGG